MWGMRKARHPLHLIFSDSLHFYDVQDSPTAPLSDLRLHGSTLARTEPVVRMQIWITRAKCNELSLYIIWAKPLRAKCNELTTVPWIRKNVIISALNCYPTNWYSGMRWHDHASERKIRVWKGNLTRTECESRCTIYVIIKTDLFIL